VIVDVVPKPEILDVDEGVEDETLHRIASELLANPVIEDWTVRRL
jgi:phosphoribosylformylglycinamidine (FGAM) synthase PurS component